MTCPGCAPTRPTAVATITESPRRASRRNQVDRPFDEICATRLRAASWRGRVPVGQTREPPLTVGASGPHRCGRHPLEGLRDTDEPAAARACARCQPRSARRPGDDASPEALDRAHPARRLGGRAPQLGRRVPRILQLQVEEALADRLTDPDVVMAELWVWEATLLHLAETPPETCLICRKARLGLPADLPLPTDLGGAR